MIIKKIISFLFCLIVTGVLTPSSRSPYPMPAKRPIALTRSPSASALKTSDDLHGTHETDDPRSSHVKPRQFLHQKTSSSRSVDSASFRSHGGSSRELDQPDMSTSQDYTPPQRAQTKPDNSDDGIQTTAITGSTAQFDKQLGTGVFAKQNFQIDSPVIYQSPSKRLKALESHVADIERLTKLHNTTPAGELKDQIKRTLDAKLAQVKKVYSEQMGGTLQVEASADPDTTTKTANKKQKTKLKDFFTARLTQAKKMFSKNPDSETPEADTDTPAQYRAALDRSKQKRFDNISKNLAKIDTKLSTPTTVTATEVPQKAVAKSMQAAANWAKGFFEKKLYKTFINEEVSSVLRAYNLSDPIQQQKAVAKLTEHLKILGSLTSSSKNLSVSNKKQLKTLIEKYQAATQAEHNAQTKTYATIFKQLDTLADQQASVFKRAVARLDGCTSWSQFQAKRAFDSQMNHANLDVLATKALMQIGGEPNATARAQKVDEYFATFQKPATKEQEGQLQTLKDYIVNDLWTKTTKIAKLEKQAALVKQWKQYNKDNKYWEAWNQHKTGNEPKKPQTPDGAEPEEGKIAKLEAKIAAVKELDPTLFAKKGLLQRVQHLTVPLKNKWLRAAVITAAVVVTTAAIAAIVIASYGAALAVVLPVIADIGTVAILAHRTVKQADTATGGQLTTVVQKGAEAMRDLGTNAMQAEHSAKDKRKHAKANILTSAVAQKEKVAREIDRLGSGETEVQEPVAAPAPTSMVTAKEASGKSKKKKRGSPHRRSPYRRSPYRRR